MNLQDGGNKRPDEVKNRPDRVKRKRGGVQRSASLLSKIMIPMIILALLQICAFLVLLTLNGGFSSIRQYSYNLLSEKTGNRKSYVENVFNQKTDLVYETAGKVNEITQRLLEQEDLTIDAVRTDKEWNRLLLSQYAECLISLIRRDMVNDAFIILDSGTLYDDGGTLLRPGLYLRDTDVEENSTSDNQDIFMEMGSSETARDFGIALDFEWSLYLDVTDAESGNYDFFFEPIATYADHSDTPVYNLGYWSGFSHISASQQGSIKYTLPLVAGDGTVYGVIGIGMMEKTIQRNIPASDFLSGSTCYILGLDTDGSGRYVQQLHRGNSYGRLLSPDTVLSAESPVEYDLYDFTGEGDTEVIGSIQKLNLYRSGSPYRSRGWALISAADKEMVLSTYNTLMRVVVISLLISLIISILAAIAISGRISLPVAKMVGELERSRSNNDLVKFKSSGISEIDTLAASIVDSQINLAEYASGVSRIITMSGNKLGVFMYDCRSETVFVGESLIELLGFSAFPGGDVTVSAEQFRQQLAVIDRENVIMSLPIFESGENAGSAVSDSREIHYEGPDGTVWLKFTLTRDKTNVMSLVQDITDTVAEKKEIAKVKDDEYTAKLLEANAALRAAYAAANQANHAKTDFLSRMSHDIRTPMNAIMGMTTIAQNHLDDPAKLADCFEKITSSSRYLLALINEVLDMSKIEGGKFELAEERINILELVNDLIELVNPSVKDKNHTLAVHASRVEHENVIGDSLRIRQVLMNILSNAVKYTEAGGRIDFYISEKETGQKKQGCYEFVITDNGKGMRPEFIEKVFVPFEREEDERVSKEQGTGLGMTIAYNIVKMMNGDIRVQSEVDRGSTFTVTLYLKIDETEPVLVRELEGIRVLVADDEPEACESTCEMLKDIGMRSEWVTTGKEAVERVAQACESGDEFGAVLLDWQMPGMDGVETARAIRQRAGERLPIILCSGHDWGKIEQDARRIGIDMFLSKPLFRTGLATVLRPMLDRQNRNAQDSASRDFSGYRALLVDDNELNREIAEEIFGMAKLDVESAGNGREAVERFASSPPGYYDIVFMDVQMPVMNGYEATREIRALTREDAQTVPIVAMTANAFAEDVRASLNAGMNEHLPKPLDLKRLYDTLGRWLGHDRQETDGRP